MSCFQSINDVFKKTVIKAHPELEGREIETLYQEELVCPQCGREGKEGGSALFYRIKKSNKWIQMGETLPCSECRDSELLADYINNSLKEQRSQMANRLTTEYFLLPERSEKGFKNYQETNTVTIGAKQKAIAYTKTFLSSKKDRYNLLFQGNPGTGKTHLCIAIARTIKEKGNIVGFLTAGQLLTKIKSTYNHGAMKTEADILEDLRKFDLLIIDDLGAEAVGGNDDWRKAKIFGIIESRSGKATIYTSNLTDKDLPMAVGERVYSRLHDNTKFIDLFTEDYRRGLKLNQ